MSDRVGLLGLGSNVGERRAHLQDAVGALAERGIEVLASSSVYDTDPVGEVTDQPSFLNACLRVSTGLDPLQLLEVAKGIEHALGRRDGVRHGPRVIDIDILALGDLQFSHERISIPHEQLLQRRFVLIPALELDFQMMLPDGSIIADALAQLPVSEGVRWAGPPLAV
jgi:2-amino-4-hydroxy-6-hydroxymethyldihydropteridine diphosphokinase